MQLIYNVKIENPTNHFVSVNITGQIDPNVKEMTVFLPSWSPGSYLMREYGKNVRKFKVHSGSGENIYFQQKHKGQWQLKFDHPGFPFKGDQFHISYEVYCHELTVRTSHVDESHAFLHGPSYLMGIEDVKLDSPKLTLNFPPSWSKVSTGLKDVSPTREEFVYQAKDYDELIDSPIEIGCHETDGFRYDGKDHELAFFGSTLKHKENLKKDIQTIVEHVAKTMGGTPYDEKYTFITHFVPNKYGGLEHLNSTALQFCSFNLNERKGYVKWLELVAHEYFHTWNVKRIRPKELGPFDYVNEGLTRMHWLTEGLTSFMDQLFVFRSGLCSSAEYCDMMKENFNRYLTTPGRRFHSLEDSSFNAWIKLYRPDENSLNSSISYYLKGGIVFFALNSLLTPLGKSIDDLLSLLWDRYNKNPEVGMTAEEIYQMIESISNKEVREKFEVMIQTTEELDLATMCKQVGLELYYDPDEKLSFGITPKFTNNNVFVGSVVLDGPGHKSGLNADDEILSIDGMRVQKQNFKDIENRLIANESYEILVSRLGILRQITFVPGQKIQTVKEVKIADESLMKKAFRV